MEWGVGEVAGALASHCLATGLTPQQICDDPELVGEFQTRLVADGVEIRWPDVRGPGILLDFLRRDLNAGMRQRRFARMPMTLALNIVCGSVLGAAHCMLAPDCERDVEQ